MEWLAGEKTKVVGTFPPRKPRGWTGYVEKDTAGQTNVYSIEVGTSYILHLSIHSSRSTPVCKSQRVWRDIGFQLTEKASNFA